MDEATSLDGYLFDRHTRPRSESPIEEPPRGRDVKLTAADGAPLAGSVWDARGPSRGAVVVASATGVRRRYYAPFAAWLSGRGFSVLTFDYRGIGGSRTKQARARASMSDWGERDLPAAIEWAARELGGDQVSVVGHSVGGQLVGLLPDPSPIRALVTVGSQSGDFRLWPAPSRYKMAMLWYGVAPSVTKAVGFLPGVLGVGEDLPAGVALQWARWCRRPGYLGGGSRGEARRAGFARVRAPILAFGFDDDDYAPPAAVDALLALFSNADVRRRQIGRDEARVGHFGFFRERHRDLWREAAAFLEGHAD